MEKNVYMHSVNHGNFFSKRDIKTVSYILADKNVLSRRMQGFQDGSIFSGSDYISLCDYTKKDCLNNGQKDYNSFYSYIRHGISIAFDKDALDNAYDVVTPTLIEPITLKSLRYMRSLGEEVERFTDLPDEVQIKDKISTDHILYFTYPCEEFFYSKVFVRQESKRTKLLQEIKRFRKVLIDLDCVHPIYDIDTGILLDEEGVERILSKK